MSGSRTLTNDDAGKDPMGYADDFHAAVRDPALGAFESAAPGQAPAEARRAAVRLAAALGNCRLFGVDLGEMDGTLPAAVAIAAAQELAEEVREWARAAETLPERFDDFDVETVDDQVAEPLDQRMELWAATEAIEEAADKAYVERDSSLEALAGALDELIRAGNTLDDVLTQPAQLEVLSVAAGTHLLDNWRAMLAPRYQDLMPWWLDGVLEGAADWPTTSPTRQPVEPSRASAWFRSAALAAAVADEWDPVVKWEAPDRSAFALLDRVTTKAPQETVPLKFFAADGRRWSQGAGQPVRLGTLTSVVEADAAARFPCADLVALAESSATPPDLIVGSEETRWKSA